MKLRNYFNQKKLHCLQKPSKQRFDNIYKAIMQKSIFAYSFYSKTEFRSHIESA